MTSFDVAALIAEKCEAFITPVRLAGAERAFLSRIAAAYVGGARLFVRGPNIMLGYYRAKNPGVIEALSGGLYDMGDIVAIDRQGFVAIKGRAKRFAKIAGESVSLGSIEEIIAGLWPEHIAAAIAAPDPKRGERVILATTKPGATRAEAQTWMKIKGASEIMYPSSVVVLESIPLLGSGKTNYVALAKALRESGA